MHPLSPKRKNYPEVSDKVKETLRALDEITDAGLFERMASSVLRVGEPKYRRLIHTGVNIQGNTVTSPVDGVFRFPNVEPPHFGVVHHTRCKRDELRRKWLAKGSQTKSPGDVVGTLRYAAKERARINGVQFTLILTTNRIPGEDLVRDVHAKAREGGVEVDIWDVSRLQHVLDFTSDGQWIRRQYLRIEQERLSVDLLRELGLESLATIPHFDKPSNWVDRKLDGHLREAVRASTNGLFVVGRSGQGKSVACHKLLTRHLEADGLGICLPHHIVETAPTLHSAIDTALRQLHPSLEPDAGSKVQAFLDGVQPFLVVVEDVNKSTQPALVVERLISWMVSATTQEGSKRGAARKSMLIACPIWPQILATVAEAARKEIENLSLYADAFEPDEGAIAVAHRAQQTGRPVSPLEAATLSKALGHDPLLIALAVDEHKPITNATEVLSRFVNNRIERTAKLNKDPYTVPEYSEALRALALAMLVSKRMDPLWKEIADWFQDDEKTLTGIRHLVAERELCRLDRATVQEQPLAFRHDRVREWILADALGNAMVTGNASEEVLANPFFAGVVGGALLHADVPDSWVWRVQRANPLALFEAFRAFGSSQYRIHQVIVTAISQWLEDPLTHCSANQHLRWAVQQALAETDSPLVLQFAESFDDRSLPLLEAKARNGDIIAASSYCYAFELPITTPHCDRLIGHLAAKFRDTCVYELRRLLVDPDTPERCWRGALRLAGHINEAELLNGISARLDLVAKPFHPDVLADFIWAVLRCSDESTFLLDPLMEAWAALPDKAEKPDGWQPRYEVSVRLRDIIKLGLPEKALRYLVACAERTELRVEIFYTLSRLDQPDAVELAAHYTAEVYQRAKEKSGINLFKDVLLRDWDRNDVFGQQMSRTSRGRLKEIWRDDSNDPHLRCAAFDLWAASAEIEDVDTVKHIGEAHPLYEAALRFRMELGDLTVIPLFLKKLDDASDRYYWWQFTRHNWSDEITCALDDEFARRGRLVKRTWDAGGYGTDRITAELLTRLDAVTCERLLVKHWNHLRFHGRFVQVALFHATSVTVQLAHESLKKGPNPKSRLRFLSYNFGIKIGDHPGVTSMRPLDALTPYLDLLDSLAIYLLWDLCNERGWFDWRRQHLDHRLSDRERQRAGLDQASLFADLDRFADEQPLGFVRHWIERFRERGDPNGYVMRVTRRWLRERQTLKAFRVAAEIVLLAGRWDDLFFLDVCSIKDTEEVIAIRENTRFAVHRRILC